MTALRRRKPPAPPFPVVLAHGIFGFDTVGLGNLRQEYFRGIARALRACGTEVHVVRVSPVGSIADRAAELAQQIRLLKARRVNIVAHSMGGLDARYALSKLSLSRCVASLTTIGTPHGGTPIADRGVRLAADQLRLRKMIEALGARAFDDLTTAKMAAFNEQVPDAPGVAYASYLGSVKGGARRVNVLLIPGFLYLKKVAGGNDGIVPAESQKWGEVIEEVEADHWAQIGWSTSFNALPLYERIVSGLRARGL